MARRSASSSAGTDAVTFDAVLEPGGKTATGITVPPRVVEQLGSHKRPPVKVTIGSHTYRSTIATMGGAFRLPVSAENRERAGISAGDAIAVTLELDTETREVDVPPDFAAALAGAPAAEAAFGRLSNSRKSWFVLGIEGAKTSETRQRRIARALATLSEG